MNLIGQQDAWTAISGIRLAIYVPDDDNYAGACLVFAREPLLAAIRDHLKDDFWEGPVDYTLAGVSGSPGVLLPHARSRPRGALPTLCVGRHGRSLLVDSAVTGVAEREGAASVLRSCEAAACGGVGHRHGGHRAH